MARTHRGAYPEDRGMPGTERGHLVSVRLQERQIALLEGIGAHMEMSRSQCMRGAIEAWAAQLGIRVVPRRADPRQVDWVGPTAER